ncbi:MAG TPA: Ig-like domain-containing domain [Saprospiraceae bacterium]|nr:Ig-like domain-containing domain [Saprospiraceae bacterium]HNE66324.1 Ig-like domain-containing domain [Saprospiraceae bacterium]HNG06474.1 Ig-like domain-containing domain [Saprospiraceae bacterium]HNL95192.1 Ig-like domain-containing domain [Saprospiraceae bacterium]
MTLRNKYLLNLLAGCIYALYMAACANPIAPEGGAKDTTPPRVDSLRSSVSGRKNFTKEPVVFRFDEWVVLDNIGQQLLVSPPTVYAPKVVLKGKTVHFTFDNREVLKENTTYSISLGEAVKDLTEGNVAKDVRFVFSTGDQIDSASLFSTIKLSLTKESVKGAVAMLYEAADNDSVIIKRKPDYFARGGETGTFTIENIRPGRYKVFALKDDNLNYLYDLDSEMIGFADSVLVIDKNEHKTITAMEVSKEAKPPRISDKRADRYGLVQCTFNGNPKLVKTEIVTSGQEYIAETDKDTLKIWYKPEPDTDWEVHFDNGVTKDTVRVKPKSAKEDKRRKTLLLLNQKAYFNKRIVETEPFRIDLTNPVSYFDTSRIMLMADSLPFKSGKYLELRKDKPRAIFVNAPWEEGVHYKMTMLPGSATDMYGNKNDTIRADWRVLTGKDLGNISLNIDNLDAEKAYIVQLLNAGGEVLEEFNVQNERKWEKLILNKQPGKYEVVIIVDLNRNGIWDPVRLFPRRQAEPIFRKKPDALRANWELNVTISL